MFLQFIPRSFPFHRRTIFCPFWSDIDLTEGGRVFYSPNGSRNAATLDKAANQIRDIFGIQHFDPIVVFVSTWYQVIHYQVRAVAKSMSKELKVLLLTVFFRVRTTLITLSSVC